MNMPNEDSGKRGDTANLEQSLACGPGCACNTARPAGKARWIVGVIVLIAAGLLVARAMVKNNGVSTDTASGFATAQAIGQTPSPDGGTISATNEAPTVSDTVVGKEITALSDLNVVATDMDGVFVFLPGKTEATAKAPTEQIQGAVRTIEPRLRGGGKIGIFTLKSSSRDYEQIASQMTVPGVLAMVKGRGMSAVSGDITETKLIQAFVGASSAGGCGPSGCGPSGCN